MTINRKGFCNCWLCQYKKEHVHVFISPITSNEWHVCKWVYTITYFVWSNRKTMGMGYHPWHKFTLRYYWCLIYNEIKLMKTKLVSGLRQTYPLFKLIPIWCKEFFITRFLFFFIMFDKLVAEHITS